MGEITLKRLLIGSLLVFCSGCGKTVDLGEFGPYVDEFSTQAQKYGLPMRINSLVIRRATIKDDGTNEILGQCNMSMNMTPTIDINEAYWNGLDSYTRKALVFHELGHCILLRAHRNDLDATNKPSSLMNMYVVGSWYFNDSTYDHYMKELFTEND